MPDITLGRPAADFCLPSTQGQPQCLADLRGRYVILYFYPKDATPGCTLESQAFRDHHEQLTALNAVVLGVSRDSLSSHGKFKGKQCLPFDLLSDSEETVCELYQVLKDKNMYGKQVRGIERSTFLIDPSGIVRHIWRKVKVDGHVQEVIASLQALAAV